MGPDRRGPDPHAASRAGPRHALRESEEGYLARVIDYARYCGWEAYHTRDSRRSEAGWPDLALMRPPRLILAELKADAGRPTPAQRKWLYGLEACDQLEVYLWRPGHWPYIERTLSRRR